MTRFVGDAVGVRAGRAKGYTAKERRRDLEIFKETGVRFDLQPDFLHLHFTITFNFLVFGWLVDEAYMDPWQIIERSYTLSADSPKSASSG